MAGKKRSKRFVIPDEDELDRPIENIKKGSTFAARSKTSEKAASVFAGKDRDVSLQQGVEQKEKSARPGDNAVETLATARSDDKKEKDKNSTNSLNSEQAQIIKNVEKAEPSVKNNEAGSGTSKTGTNSIIVNARQRGNPVLKYIRNVPWEFGEAVPDYILGQTTCALFLSLRYHNFNPEYIHERLKELGSRFVLRILLVLVDVKNPHASLKELAKICILSDCTLILSWSNEEAGRYLETYKCYENKPADILQEKVDGDHHSKMIDCLTSVKSVNKTDAVTLMANFGSLRGIVNASKEEISLCPGFGPQKAERVYKMFHEPFIKNNKIIKQNQHEEIDEITAQEKLVEEHTTREKEMDT